MSTEITKKTVDFLAVVPDHLREVKGHEGMENVNKNDLILPRLAICQGNNPQRKKANPLYIEGLEDGDLFNTVTNEVYGNKLQFIPLLKTGSRILFAPLEEGGGILCRSMNGIDGGSLSPTCDTCPKSKWQADGTPPECTEFLNFPSVIAGTRQLIVESWKSTALKPARTWLTRVNMLVEKHNKPFYSWVTEVQLNPDKNDSGEFYVPTFTLKRWSTPEEFEFASRVYHDLKGKTIVVEAEPERSDVVF